MNFHRHAGLTHETKSEFVKCHEMEGNMQDLSSKTAIVVGASRGLGRAINDFEQVRPGDFISYSTTPAGGHSVIFINWLRDDQKKIIGFKYFSSNLSGTDGVGYGSGKFSDVNPNGRGILRNSLNIGHVGSIKDYSKFDRAAIPQRNAYAPTQPDRVVYLPAPGAEGSGAGK